MSISRHRYDIGEAISRLRVHNRVALRHDAIHLSRNSILAGLALLACTVLGSCGAISSNQRLGNTVSHGRIPLSPTSAKAGVLYLEWSTYTEAIGVGLGHTYGNINSVPNLVYFGRNGTRGYLAGYVTWGYLFPRSQVYSYNASTNRALLSQVAGINAGCASGMVFSPVHSIAYVLIGLCSENFEVTVTHPWIDAISTTSNKVLRHIVAPISTLIGAIVSPGGSTIWENGIALDSSTGQVLGRLRCPGLFDVTNEIGIAPNTHDLIGICPGESESHIEIFDTKTFTPIGSLYRLNMFYPIKSFMVDRGHYIAMIGSEGASRSTVILKIISASKGTLESTTTLYSGNPWIAACVGNRGLDVAVISSNPPSNPLRHYGRLTIKVINTTDVHHPSVHIVPFSADSGTPSCSLVDPKT